MDSRAFLRSQDLSVFGATVKVGVGVRFSARHHREVFPTELASDEEIERGSGEW
jgi:hypothetical protein